ncbi:HAAS signaling domain-containing protein [Actinoplanes sp. NPDC048988]|uniref:HAAS signaling domain-containing protein n=1 Tax=Actinoplanes sp. NPDC048988 TaxID=3363901 RepID=UPI0037201962
MNITEQDEIAEYVAGVRQALADLPDATRDELLEDLPEHLAEVRAEGTGTLTERLGTPAAYAAELRATAGFVGGFPDPPRGAWVTAAEIRAKVMPVLDRADVKVGPLIGYPRASEFLTLLRPAWWVLRGYLVAMALAMILDSSGGSPGLLPRVGGSNVIALMLLAVGVAGSILLGKRGVQLSQWPRWALYSGTTVLVIFGLAGFTAADNGVRGPGFSDVSSYQESNPYNTINDLFVYDEKGTLVPNARVFDQNGNAVQFGGGYCTDPNTGETWHTRNLGYPYCPQDAPFGPAPSADPRPSFLENGEPAPADPSPTGPSATDPSPGRTPAAAPAPSGASASPTPAPSSRSPR